jgi:hypothetical protein
MPTEPNPFEALGVEHGYGTIAHLLDVIVSEREEFTLESALSAAEQLDWDDAWDSIIGPAIDQLSDLLSNAGAVADDDPQEPEHDDTA